MDPTMSEATKHAILTLAELDDWEGVEETLDQIVTEYWLANDKEDKVANGVIHDMNRPPVVEPSAFWPAVIVVGCCLAWVGIAVAVSLFRGV